MHKPNKNTIALTILYILLCALSIQFIVQLILKYFTSSSGFIGWLGATVYIILSVSGIYWNVGLILLKTPMRKPMQKEEERIMKCLNILKQRSSQIKNMQVKIIVMNSEQINAYALGRKTICVSLGTLCLTTEDELCAILAHELGHIICGDTICSSINFTAKQLMCYFTLPAIKIWILFCRFPLNLKLAVVSISTMLFYFYSLLTMDIGIVAAILIFGFKWFNIFIAKLHLYFDRLTEYHQDAFAASLGLRDAMKMVLLKLICFSNPADYSLWDIFNHHSHPLLHHRIIALDKLGADREQSNIPVTPNKPTPA